MKHVIIPVFNRVQTTLNCLESLTAIEDDEIRIVIVDDGSTDDTESLVLDKYPQVKVLKGTGELFWTGAVRMGIEYVLEHASPKDWIILANNDVTFKRDVFEELVRVAEKENRRAIVSSLSIDSQDRETIIKTGSVVRSWFFNSTKHIYEGNRLSDLKNRDPVAATVLTGRCLLHPVEVFSEAGNYDAERFRHYAGDDEFSVRAARFGFKMFVAPRSIVYLDTSTTGDIENLWTGGVKTVVPRFFGIRSSINIVVKWRFAVAAAPFYAVPTYYLVAVLKSIYIFMRRP